VTSFLICVALGFAKTLIDNIFSSQRRIRFLSGWQQGNYGGIIFYIVATTLTWALVLWLIYLAGRWIVSLF
jgi:hypothetical protein